MKQRHGTKKLLAPLLSNALLVVAVWGVGLWVPVAWGQAVDGDVPDDAPPPALTYHRLVPGLSTANDVRKTLGEPLHEAKWYAWKMLYPAEGRPGLFDSVHTRGKKGRFANVEAASIPAGYETLQDIYGKLGKPEYELRMPSFTMLDYAEQGVRFVLDKTDQTIGVAYFPHMRRRVHAGARHFLDLRHLRSGPQPPPAQPASLNGLKAGVAEVLITPKAQWLDPRYRERFTVHDDLKARCIVFEQGEKTLALVGADLFGMSLTAIQPMIERTAKAGVEDFVLAMSHVHSAPDTIGVYGHFPAEYVQYIQDQVVACVAKAQQNLQPVKQLRAAARELPMDGARVIGYFRNARNPGILDPTVSVLQVIGADDQPLATLVHLACHPEGIEAGPVECSADFPGYLCEQVRRDGGGQPIFLNGALGGMVSGDTKARTHDEAKKMGLGLAAVVKQLAAEAQPPETFRFETATMRVEIPMTNRKFKPLYKVMGRPLVRGRVVTHMKLIRLGECEMVTLPGELLPEVGFEILEHMQGFPHMLIGLANDELGYIVPAYDFRDDEYEESMSQGPAAAPVVRDTAIRLLHGVR